MELFGVTQDLMDQLPGLIARMWAAEISLSLIMVAIVSIRVMRPAVVLTALGIGLTLVGGAWLATKFSRPKPPVVVEAAAAQGALAQPEPAAQRPRTHRRTPRKAPPVNCLRVLTDPSQSTC